MPDLYDVTAAEAARRIRSGALSPSNLLASCLKRIDADFISALLARWVSKEQSATDRRSPPSWPEMSARKVRQLERLANRLDVRTRCAAGTSA